jgi:hypothetical protein
MARFYSNENFPLPAVIALQRLGHDVHTSYDAGLANQRVEDQKVLEFAHQQSRAVLTINRKHFLNLHRQNPNHPGIVICSRQL